MFWRRLLALLVFTLVARCSTKEKAKAFNADPHSAWHDPSGSTGAIFHDTIKSLFNPINVMYALVVAVCC